MAPDNGISAALALPALRRAVNDVGHHRTHRVGDAAQLGKRSPELKGVQLLRLVKRPLLEQRTREAVAGVLEPLQRLLIAVDDGSNDHLQGRLDAALGNDLFLVAEDLSGTKIRGLGRPDRSPHGRSRSWEPVTP